MKKTINHIVKFIKTRKILSVFIAIILLGGLYYVYGKVFGTTPATTYITANVKKGNIVSTITGTGQVSAQNQIDIKSKVSGDLVYLNKSANGTQIAKGTLIAQIDTRDASISLQNAKIAYQKLVKPADEPTTLQAESSLDSAIFSNAKAYDDAFGYIVNGFSDTTSVLKSLKDLLYSNTGYLNSEKIRYIGQTAINSQKKAASGFDKVQSRYDILFDQYKTISYLSASSTIESFTSSTYILVKDLSEVLKDTQNTLDYVRQEKGDGSGSTESTNLISWINTVNNDLADLLSSQTAFTTTKQNIVQKKSELIKLKNGPDNLDLESQRLSLEQAQNSYNDYFIRAPFDGLLARLSVKSVDSVNSGTIIGTLVSSQKITTITLNEVDVAKVRVGQKAKLTFDAIDGLSIDGTVVTVDLVGTVTQGVVNYNVEISLDTQDDRVKSGMSVSASIITDSKDNVLSVPNSAVKTQGKLVYVETLINNLPKRMPVEVGISNDTVTEIVSGINEGDKVITRTVLATTAKATTAPSLFGAAGARTGTGGAARTGVPRN